MSKIKAETGFSLKDQLFNEESVRVLSKSIQRVYSDFSSWSFEQSAREAFPNLELKARIHWMVQALDEQLPSSFSEAVAILEAALPPPLDPNLSDDDFGKFIWVVPGEYVAKNGCTKEHIGRSLSFLREATKRFSSESAVRPFLRKFPEDTCVFFMECTEDSNYHVRRWVSEGSRPYLPWAERVVLSTEIILMLLEPLYSDCTRYVTRSVANNLNDLSRIDEDAVLDTLARWGKENRQKPKEMAWLTKHALRTLTKKGHKRAFEYLGYSSKPKYEVNNVSVSRSVQVGQHLEWSASLISKAEQSLKVGLSVGFLKANGQHQAKLFKLADIQAHKGEVVVLAKRLLIRPMTTRALYPGEHYVELVVNGEASDRASFELVG